MAKQEIGTNVHSSNITAATGGGLIPALIDIGIEHSRAKKAEVAVVPVRDALLGYDVGKVFADCLRRELGQEDWAKTADIEVRSAANLGSADKLVAASNTDLVVTLRTNYELTADFDCIEISVVAAIHPRSPLLISRTKENNKDLSVNKEALYYNTLSTERHVGWPAGGVVRPTLADWARAWSADGGRPVREAIDSGLAELARMIAFDLKQPGTPSQAIYKLPDGADFRMATVPPGMMVKGQVVHSEDKRFWLRLPSGELRSIDR